MRGTILLFLTLIIPYIAYSQNDSPSIAGKYVCHQSTGWYNSTDPSTGNSIEVVPLPLWDATLILIKNGTFSRSTVIFSDDRETIEKGNWSIQQDSLVLHITTSKLSLINFETTVDTEEKLKIDLGSRLLIKHGEVYSKTE
ncbi:MAG: hypothetical protein EOP53_16830 [Sphingobacteriales bacterium]|nr:MAG: hypothetical protein EOP53_16830 [Sphingobacteriales bacterium]